MFNFRKVQKARNRLRIITGILFKFFQISLMYREKEKNMGLKSSSTFTFHGGLIVNLITSYNKIKDYTLNPKSRLYILHELSKYYLKENTTFIEVGTWRGGVCGLISLVNEDKNFDLYACDSFDGVKKSSEHDSFFKDGEYSDTGISDIRKVEELLIHKINVVEGTFPESMVNEIQNPISFAHIDVDTYFSAKESFEYISKRLIKGGVVVLDDYGGWFTDGVTRYGNELKNNTNYFVVPNHIGQLIIFKK